MNIGAGKELHDARVALIPETVKKMTQIEECNVFIESDAGKSSGYEDAEYKAAGAVIVDSRNELLNKADFFVSVSGFGENDIEKMKEGSVVLSFLDPFNNRNIIDLLVNHQITSFSMEMIPRSTIAQKMDAISSQASLAGYAAVIEAAAVSQRIFPMMMTPAGTISPSRVFVIGAGVAGLQAIATAKRLGARVEAFDTRPAVEEQVQSLGARFIKIDLGETGQTKDGYAVALTAEQLSKQQALMKERCLAADIVITTAKLFGKKAPVIITRDTVESMKPGSVVVDLAVETGGNVEGSEAGKTVEVSGTKIIGIENMPGTVAYHASQMFSSNVFHFISEIYDSEVRKLKIDGDNEIATASMITHGGKLVNQRIQSFYNDKSSVADSKLTEEK